MAWISWEKLTKTKKDGGLGFRDIQCFNDTMLAKLCWRMIEEPNCPLAKVLKGKYCTSSSLLECSTLSSASNGLRGILAGRDLLVKHLGCAIGNGDKVNVWDDHWLSPLEQKAPMGPAE